MSKIKYLVFFCLLILLCLGLAATGSAREQPADMIIVASDHHGDDDDDFISKKEAAKELKPGIDSKVKVNVKKDDEQDEDKEDEKEHR
ncbi:MAG: hypothetical protein M1609_09390, partial [Firmicutes bacterium]|nr:hypothetical protein [Bacillota bacterium]